MDDSPLSRLPGEIRNEIYDLVFAESESLRLAFQKSDSKGGTFSLDPASQRETHPVALLGTCKQIWQEAKGMAWSRRGFVIRILPEDAEVAIKELINQAGEENIKSIPCLTLDIGAYLSASRDQIKQG